MNDRPTLLQTLPGVTVGGIERYGLTIGLAAASRGWKVHSAFPHTAENGSLIGAFRDGGVTTHPLDHRTSGPPQWELAAAAARTARLVARVRPSVAHVNIPLPNFDRGTLIGCALGGVPTVAVLHTAPPDRLDLGRSRGLYRLLRRRGQSWVTVSLHDRAQIAPTLGLPEEEVTVIQNGIPPVAERAPSGDERAAVRREMGLADTSFIVLGVGRLSRQKGYDYLIRVVADIADRFPDAHFVIAGEGESRAELERLIDSHDVAGHVHLVGQRDDVDRLLRSADLFVFPSRFEGFPFALLEAAAHGLPIVSSDISGVDEIVVHEESALLYPEGDTEALSRCLDHAMGNPKEMRTMGERAKQEAGRFSQETMVDTTLALLEERAER